MPNEDIRIVIDGDGMRRVNISGSVASGIPVVPSPPKASLISCEQCKKGLTPKNTVILGGSYYTTVCIECWSAKNYINCHGRRSCFNYGVISETMFSLNGRAGEYYCKKCLGRYGFNCVKCGCGYKGDQYGLEGSCINCLKASRCLDVKKRFKIEEDHNYKPRLVKFYGEAKNNLYFGMELELEVNKGHKKDVAFSLAKHMEEVYMVHDGSIGYGFELVTYPMTYEYLTQTFKLDLIEKLGADKIACSWRKTCGMHFHISKCAFSPLHRYKFLRFMYQNQDFCEVIGQRKFNDFCRRANSNHRDVIEKAYYKRQEDRYEFINLRNPFTIELRFFKGNMLKDRILKNAEFVKALYEYTKTASVLNLDAKEFLAYITNNKTVYKHLYKFCKRRSITCANWETKQIWKLPTQPTKDGAFANLGPYYWNDGNFLSVPWPTFKHILNVGYRVLYKANDGFEYVFYDRSDYQEFYKQEQRYLKEGDNPDGLASWYTHYQQKTRQNLRSKDGGYPEAPKLVKSDPMNKFYTIEQAESARSNTLGRIQWDSLARLVPAQTLRVFLSNNGNPGRVNHELIVDLINYVNRTTLLILPDWALPYLTPDPSAIDLYRSTRNIPDWAMPAAEEYEEEEDN